MAEKAFDLPMIGPNEADHPQRNRPDFLEAGSGHAPAPRSDFDSGRKITSAPRGRRSV